VRRLFPYLTMGVVTEGFLLLTHYIYIYITHYAYMKLSIFTALLFLSHGGFPLLHSQPAWSLKIESFFVFQIVHSKAVEQTFKALQLSTTASPVDSK
jgi:hypothetical protein